MNQRYAISVLILSLLILSACGPVPDPVFHISGSPDPLMYGGCGSNTLTLKVTGPGDNVKVNSIIASYNLFDGSGRKVKTGSILLKPSPSEPPVTYVGSVTFSIGTGATGSSPDSLILDFGEGSVEFGAFVDADLIKHPDSGPYKPVGHTEVKSIPVIACLPTPTAPPLIRVTIVPPGSADKPKRGGDEPPAPPSCSTDPNNPSCVPGP
jgi:hypothetical protein